MSNSQHFVSGDACESTPSPSGNRPLHSLTDRPIKNADVSHSRYQSLMAHQAAALSSPSHSSSLAHPSYFLFSSPFPMQFFSYSPHPSSLPLHSPLFQKKDLTQDYIRLKKNHRLLSIYFYFDFPLHFSQPKSFWPTLSLYLIFSSFLP